MAVSFFEKVFDMKAILLENSFSILEWLAIQRLSLIHRMHDKSLFLLILSFEIMEFLVLKKRIFFD